MSMPWRELQRGICHSIAYEPENHSYAAFGHLMGYGAKYYGYLWSRVYALDIFQEIKAQGLLNPQVGQQYIRDILSKGGSRRPEQVAEKFFRART